jgi:hypothetical protein
MSTDDDYDKLSKEEREARDKADRDREAEEQAGVIKPIYHKPLSHSISCTCIALPYAWRQELGDVDITVPVPKGTRAKNLIVVIKKKRLSVAIKGGEIIMEGELCNEIKVEESTWTLGSCILIRGRANLCLIFLPGCRRPAEYSYSSRETE